MSEFPVNATLEASLYPLSLVPIETLWLGGTAGLHPRVELFGSRGLNLACVMNEL